MEVCSGTMQRYWYGSVARKATQTSIKHLHKARKSIKQQRSRGFHVDSEVPQALQIRRRRSSHAGIWEVSAASFFVAGISADAAALGRGVRIILLSPFPTFCLSAHNLHLALCTLAT